MPENKERQPNRPPTLRGNPEDDRMVQLLVSRYKMTPDEAAAWVRSLAFAPDPGVIHPNQIPTNDSWEADRWARYAQQIKLLEAERARGQGEPTGPWALTRGQGMAGVAAERIAKGQPVDHLMNTPPPPNRAFSLSVDGTSGPPLPAPPPRPSGFSLSVDGTSGVPQDRPLTWDAFKTRLVHQMQLQAPKKTK